VTEDALEDEDSIYLEAEREREVKERDPNSKRSPAISLHSTIKTLRRLR
jgi:hypothetical protein